MFGGKITTYRHLAEEVLGKLKPWLPEMSAPWTQGTALPGGDFPIEGGGALVAEIMVKYPQIPTALLERFACTYGTLTTQVLGEAETENDLGRHFGGGLYQREVDYQVHTEWARTAEDILWRRTKLGLRMSEQDILGLSV